MLNVLLVIHLIACISLVFIVLLQRSEGGALGMGGGGTGGLISGRGAANVLVKATMGLAAVFFTTSVVMTRLNADQARAPTDLERELQGQQNPFSPSTTPAPGANTTPPVTTPPAATAPTVPDPLAPSAPASPAPAPADTTTPPAESTAPAQPAPAQPAPDPLAPAQNQ